MRPTVLSTKTLTTSQKELLLNAKLGVVEHDFITTKALHFDLQKPTKNLIFTSQNAVHYFFETPNIIHQNPAVLHAFCVGNKTKAALEQKGLKVVEKAENASLLAQKLSKHYKKDHFLFVCGPQRRNELPDILTSNAIAFEECYVYETQPRPIRIQRFFEGVLFYSPSGVQSYTAINALGPQTCFCIGNTTATEVRKHSDNIVVATTPTLENVIVQVIKYFRS